MKTLCAILAVALLASPTPAADWLHWRGPNQNGVAFDTGLPDKWSPEGQNLIWKKPFGGRSTPLVSKGRVYIINGAGEGITEQERVMCFDAKSGEVLWEHKFNIFLCDIVTNRVGWANIAADPETGNIYAHGVQGLFFCFSPEGKVLWSKSLTEEFGRITGYGGRVTSPIVDEDVVIMNFLNSSWGEHGRGGHRFLAMDKKTGEIRWWSEPGGQPLDTIYSVPVIATIGGQRLLICGTADGGVTAIKARTGQPVWHYVFNKRGTNVSPVVAGNRVYASHSEENLDTNIQGAVVCLDGSKVTNGQPEVVWKRNGIMAGYASPIIHEGRLYVPDNSATLYCLHADTGDELWKYKYGTVAKGSPVWCDGKIFVGEVSAKFHILQPSDSGCKRLSAVDFTRTGGTVVEINGSPAISDGKLFFCTQDETFCIGTKEGKRPVPTFFPAPDADPNRKPAHLQIVPADVVLPPGGSAVFKVRTYDEEGNFLKDAPAEEWSLPLGQPPATAPPGTKPTPALQGKIDKNGKLELANVPAQAGVVEAKLGGLTAKARVRVAPLLPINQDFEKIPEGAVPGGWVNVGGKFIIETKDGGKVLKKLANNPNPLLARANAYITMPTAKDYTIEADLMGTERRRYMPNMGVVNCRYTLWFDGSYQRLCLSCWEANHRLEKKIDYKWRRDVWYRFKLFVTVEGDKAICKGKVWPRDEKEPEAWTIEIEDPIPNSEGSAALYGYAYGIPPDLETARAKPGAEIFYDNVKVRPNKAK